MRTLIYKLFFVVGIFASTFGMTHSANASIHDTSAEQSKPIKIVNTDDNLYFSDVINTSDSQLVAAHYSHSSHSSHSSHRSHYSARY